jgi:hypothetical protein
MRLAFVVSALAACGTTEVRTTQRLLAPVIASEPGVLQYRTEVHDAAIVIFATFARRCQRDVVDLVLDGATSHYRRAGGYSWACPVAAPDTRIHLEVPGGFIIDGTTDEQGELVYLIPSAP